MTHASKSMLHNNTHASRGETWDNQGHLEEQRIPKKVISGARNLTEYLLVFLPTPPGQEANEYREAGCMLIFRIVV